MPSFQSLLTIAGTDPTSGAGVTADIQVFRDFGYHGLWVPTAVIDQDSASIHDIIELPSVEVGRMVGRILAGGEPAGIKLGVLFSADIAVRVVEAIEAVASRCPVVVDPVLASGLGDELSRRDLVTALRDRVLPIASLVTPNVPEAERFLERRIGDMDDAREAARDLVSMGARSVLLKGGHLPGAPGDVLCCSGELYTLPNREQFLGDVHGSGCHLSSAVTALLAMGWPVEAAVRGARTYLPACVRSAVRLNGEGQPDRLVVVHGDETRRVAAEIVKGGPSSTPV